MSATHIDPALQAALAADNPLVFWAIEIDFPAYTLRLVDGAGFVSIGGQTFVGFDDTYGALIGPDEFNDGVAAEAPHLTFQIQPPTNVAAATLCNPSGQGSIVSLYYGAINPATGQPIGTTALLWQGDLDTATLVADRGSRIVKVDAESSWDRFFDVDEGLTLTNACHQGFWPGELGLEYVTQIQVQLPWGTDSPRPVVVHDVPNGSPTYSNGSASPYVGGSNGGGYGGAVGARFDLAF